ncbi:hypothetical protein [Reichenbachiella versicolor]|uniref:hypothetical protein n=1 Tax=Reichenbachiella versicolor TaxID=1821036 RepID=UPI000D6E092E|nr:hypothetical protein [Reichenbachiella versicolor]
MIQFNEYSINFEHNILQILPSTNSEYLFVLTCDTESKLFTAFLLDSKKLNIIKQRQFPTDFKALAVKAYSIEKIVLTHFSEFNNPDIIDLVVFDWENDQPLVDYPSIKPKKVTLDSLSFEHPTIQNKVINVDLLSGNEVLELNEEKISDEHTRFPISYSKESEYFKWFTKLLRPYDINPIQKVYYLKIENVLILSTNVMYSDAVRQVLIVLDTLGKICHKHLFEEAEPLISFHVNEKLLYINTKHRMKLLVF